MQIKYRGLKVSLKAIKMEKAMAGPYFKHFDQQVVLKSVERIRKYILCCGLVAIQSSLVRFLEESIILYRGYY